MLLKLFVSLMVFYGCLFRVDSMKRLQPDPYSGFINSIQKHSSPIELTVGVSQRNGFATKVKPVLLKTSTFIDDVINRSGKISANGKTYPVCVNNLLRETLQREKHSGERQVTDLLLNKKKYCESMKFSNRTYNIHFILRSNGDRNEIDIRPTASMR